MFSLACSNEWKNVRDCTIVSLNLAFSRLERKSTNEAPNMMRRMASFLDRLKLDAVENEIEADETYYTKCETELEQLQIQINTVRDIEKKGIIEQYVEKYETADMYNFPRTPITLFGPLQSFVASHVPTTE